MLEAIKNRCQSPIVYSNKATSDVHDTHSGRSVANLKTLDIMNSQHQVLNIG